MGRNGRLSYPTDTVSINTGSKTMHFKPNISIAGSLCLVLTGFASSSGANEEDCLLPDMILTMGEITFVDNGDEGVSPGDNRILTHYLADENGQEIGFVNVISTVLHSPAPDTTTMYAEGSIHVDAGTLHWSNTSTLEDAADTSRTTDEAFDTIVVGGTGAFRHATGTFNLSPGRTTFLICPSIFHANADLTMVSTTMRAKQMTVHHNTLTGSALAVTAMLLWSSLELSLAAAQEDCHIPDLVLRIGEIAYIDHSGDGVTPGDNRVLIHHLFDGGGEEIGLTHAVSTVLHSPSEEGTTIYVKGTFHLDGGTVYWVNTQVLADPLNTDRSTADRVETVITGGTGTYQNASGVFFVSPLEHDQYALEFDILCQG
ncbi:MAG: hypothetical protein AAF385_16285 [Pseudomonadota bacterium]